MLDVLFRLFLIGLLVTGTYALFGLMNESSTLTFSSSTVEGELQPLYPELVFLVVSWLLFLLLSHLRLTLLVGLVGGQVSLLEAFGTVHVQGASYPIYGLIVLNSFFLLVFYFYFASERWSSGSLKDASDVYKRNDS